MGKGERSVLNQRIGRLRWQAPVVAVLLVLAHQIIEHTWLRHLPHWQHFLTQVLFYGIVGPFLAWWALTSLHKQVWETEAADRAVKEAHERLRRANRRLSFLIRVNRRLAEAEDEASLLDSILALSEEVLPARSVSLVTMDERGQLLPPRYRGNLDMEVKDAWTAHLGRTQAGWPCRSCQTRSADLADPCPLLHAVPATAGVRKVICLSLARGERRYGVLNIYLKEEQEPTEDEQSLLKAMAGEIALALESHALRSRELAMLSRFQERHWWRDMHEHLSAALQQTVEALEADGGAFFIDPFAVDGRAMQVTLDALPEESLARVKAIAEGSRKGQGPLVVQALQQDGLEDVRSLLATPLRVEGKAVGTLALWAATAGVFSQRRVELAAVVAAQAALLVENHHLSMQMEHQAALAERARLAREIHDGLAQTLGYLKLRTSHLAESMREAQQDSMPQDDSPEAAILTELRELQELLDEAYVDAREAIDGLQLSALETDLRSWVGEAVRDFEILSGIPVTLEAAEEIHLPREAQTQLQRIIQEALSNVRKHAAAGAVRVGWDVADDSWLALHIEDDGCGFYAEGPGRDFHHGLRIMRERAQLLGGKLQIESQPGQGTQVTVRLPRPAPIHDREGR